MIPKKCDIDDLCSRRKFLLGIVHLVYYSFGVTVVCMTFVKCNVGYLATHGIRTFGITRAEHVVNTHVMSLLILNKLHDQKTAWNDMRLPLI